MSLSCDLCETQIHGDSYRCLKNTCIGCAKCDTIHGFDVCQRCLGVIQHVCRTQQGHHYKKNEFININVEIQRGTINRTTMQININNLFILDQFLKKLGIMKEDEISVILYNGKLCNALSVNSGMASQLLIRIRSNGNFSRFSNTMSSNTLTPTRFGPISSSMNYKRPINTPANQFQQQQFNMSTTHQPTYTGFGTPLPQPQYPQFGTQGNIACGMQQ
jgi:hypothetical protein